MINILRMDNIAEAGLKELVADSFTFVDSIEESDAILVRSTKLHDCAIPPRVKAIARAGVGTDNIPVERMSQQGVPVLFAPGGNANAVKELVLAAILMGYRNLDAASQYLQKAQPKSNADFNKNIEKAKKQFAGHEIQGKTLGVIGLGNIGVQVADAALHLGMQVLGFDPNIRIENALSLNPKVMKVETIEALLSKSDIVSIHVPLVPKTTAMVNETLLSSLKPGSLLINFSRGGIADEASIIKALDKDILSAYITDFPTIAFQKHPKVLCFPHLGASTKEAEENCARMVCRNLRNFLLNGNLSHCVNFPNIALHSDPSPDSQRVFIVNDNSPGMIAHLSQSISELGYNIDQMINQSRNTLACNIIDLSPKTDDLHALLIALENIRGVLRVIPKMKAHER